MSRIRLPEPGHRVVVRYLLPSGQATDALGELLSADAETVRVEREPGRLPLPVITAAPGSTALWDGRFLVEVAAGFSHALEVKALGRDGLAQLREQDGAKRPRSVVNSTSGRAALPM